MVRNLLARELVGLERTRTPTVMDLSTRAEETLKEIFA
jgi:hypothetical protein